ncbi:MAG TPA: hypothetical protein VK531_09940 [Gemmatimonadales bacterium]|nr:hypothetical protein [Gemmatimonadales bacterium]
MRSRVSCAALIAVVLACDAGLHPTTACPGICGTVTFRGAVPDSTQAVYVVAYHTFPHSRDSLFTFQPPVTSLQGLPLDGAPAFYALPVDAGRYEWVLAVWVKQGFTLATADSTLREAGYYRDPADTSQPGVLDVDTSRPDSIDFMIDFGQMHPPCRYYDPPCP